VAGEQVLPGVVLEVLLPVVREAQAEAAVTELGERVLGGALVLDAVLVGVQDLLADGLDQTRRFSFFAASSSTQARNRPSDQSRTLPAVTFSCQ
jgi:hypothetical protein